MNSQDWCKLNLERAEFLEKFSCPQCKVPYEACELTQFNLQEFVFTISNLRCLPHGWFKVQIALNVFGITITRTDNPLEQEKEEEEGFH